MVIQYKEQMSFKNNLPSTLFDTAVFKKVAFNIDFASRDGNRTHQNAFRLCDSNFVQQ